MSRFEKVFGQGKKPVIAMVHLGALPGTPLQRAQARFLARFHDLHLEPRVRALFALVLEGEAAGFADSVVTSVTQTAASVLNIALICSAYRQLSGDLERTTAAFE